MTSKKTITTKLIDVSIVTIAVAIIALVVSFKIFNLQIIFNLTESLPDKSFLLQKDRLPKRGDYILFSKPNKFYNKDFGKILLGMPGDEIKRIKNHFWIAAKESPFVFPAGVAKEFSKTGKKLKAISTGIIPPDHFYVYAPHRDSLDSRYQEIGLIKGNHIKGVLTPIDNIAQIAGFLFIFTLLTICICLIRISQIFFKGTLILLASIFIFTDIAEAKDLGVHGKIYDIAEKDLSKDMQDKLSDLEKSGKLKKLQDQWEKQAVQSIERPKSAIDLPRATKNREFAYDPSVTASKNFYDHQGNIIVKKGTRANPLHYYSLPQNLLFVNGDDQEQIDWALKKSKDNLAMIILTKGNVMQLMRNYKVRFYFDQKGFLVNAFKFKDSKTRIIKHLPAEIYQDQDLLKIREVAL